MHRRLAATALVLAAVLAPAPAAACDEDIDCPAWTERYDTQIRKYSKRYFGPSFDWRWFRAQAIAESSLRPDAVSPQGARGMLQLMPSTYGELAQANNWFPRIDDQRANIAAGIYFNRILYERWRDVASEEDALAMVFASYNAGHTRARFAFRAARANSGGTPGWQDVKAHLPRETRGYVQRIHALMNEPLGGEVRSSVTAVAADENAQP